MLREGKGLTFQEENESAEVAFASDDVTQFEWYRG